MPFNFTFSSAQAENRLDHRGDSERRASASDQQADEVTAYRYHRDVARNQMAGDNSIRDDDDDDDGSNTSFSFSNDNNNSNKDNHTTYSVDDDAFDYGVAAQGFKFPDRVIHFLSGNSINIVSRKPLEIAILIEAGTIVSSEQPMDKTTRANMMKEKYLALLDEFPSNHFDPTSVKDLMKTKMYQAKTDITGEQLWTKFLDYRSEIRSNYTSKLPTNLSTLPSGHQLSDVYNSFMLACYKAAHVSTPAAFMSFLI
jgi:hypothetical protein